MEIGGYFELEHFTARPFYRGLYELNLGAHRPDLSAGRPFLPAAFRPLFSLRIGDRGLPESRFFSGVLSHR